MTQQPIGVFDSGCGGLSVLNALRKILPMESFLYFADTKNSPYGIKTIQQITSYTEKAVHLLQEQGCKLIVIACHTASTILSTLRTTTIQVPIIDMLLPSKKMLQKELSQNPAMDLAILGTKRTIESNAYQSIIKELSSRCTLHPLICSCFIPLIEEGLVASPLTEMLIAQTLEPLQNIKIDRVLLACTHYPLLLPIMIKALSKPPSCFLDPSLFVAYAVKKTLAQKNLLQSISQNPSTRFIVSGDIDTFLSVGSTFGVPTVCAVS